MMTREEMILTILEENEKIEVNELAKILSVSEVTIRKDLDKLSERGILKREHGFAVIGNKNDLNYRLAVNYNEKKRIAELAAKSVNNGEIIMIDSGSTCALLAEELALTKEKVTIITNSAFIANYVRKYKSCEIILLGGAFQTDAQVTVGPITKQQINQFNVEKFFVGIDGFDTSKGFMGSNLMRVEIAREMMLSSQKTIMLSDSSKFKTKGNMQEFTLDEVDLLYTDKNIDKKVKTIFEANDIKVHIV